MRNPFRFAAVGLLCLITGAFGAPPKSSMKDKVTLTRGELCAQLFQAFITGVDGQGEFVVRYDEATDTTRVNVYGAADEKGARICIGTTKDVAMQWYLRSGWCPDLKHVRWSYLNHGVGETVPDSEVLRLEDGRFSVPER